MKFFVYFLSKRHKRFFINIILSVSLSPIERCNKSDNQIPDKDRTFQAIWDMSVSNNNKGENIAACFIIYLPQLLYRI